MKTKLIICLLVFLPLVLKAQDTYYYYQGEKIYLNIDLQNVNVQFNSESAKAKAAQLRSSTLELEEKSLKDKTGNMVQYKFNSTPKIADYQNTVKRLKRSADVVNVYPFVTATKEKGNKANHSVGTSDVFYVKLLDKNDEIILREIAQEKNIKVIGQVPGIPEWYKLSFAQSMNFSNSLEASSYFYETGIFENIDPGFITEYSLNCVSDPLFNQQWGLKNSTYPGIDINICKAWELTKGAGVKVAVVDTDIDMRHPDLRPNMNSINYSTYDLQNGYSPDNAPVVTNCGGSSDCLHGTHVAGIIAAAENNSQVVGVAPQATLIGFGHSFSGQAGSERLAAAIRKASDMGADVINNSWGRGTHQHIYDAILEDAIMHAINNGRNGKGCVVVFSAGNAYKSDGRYVVPAYIDYPGCIIEEILTVGNDSINGKRAYTSAYSFYEGTGPIGTSPVPRYWQGVDVVAPGSNILSTVPDNGTMIASGTSMAAPHVSGIAALILSVNPDLTGKQVRDIIESTAKKTGNYNYSNVENRMNGTWNKEVGYGLVDAYEAVKKAGVLEFKDQVFDNGRYLFLFPCHKEIVIQNVILEPQGENVGLTAASTKKIRILPPFHSKTGSFSHFISEVGWLYELGITCEPYEPVNNAPYIFKTTETNAVQETRYTTEEVKTIPELDADPVVETTYYNLQGILIRNPETEGFYIKKNLHQSEKVTIEKIYIH